MSSAEPDWPAILRATVSELGWLFGPLSREAWDSEAAHVGWNCHDTIGHITSDLIRFAGQVAAAPRDHYVPFSFDLSRARGSDQLIEVMTMAGALLAGAVEVAPPDTVGWHPHGMFDARGFAAMGCAEALVHAHDVADGLGVPWQASDELCDPVIDVLFPQALPRPPEVSGHDLLLWATGRLVPPGLPVVTNWDYRAGARSPAP
jgi:hypothetical protein